MMNDHINPYIYTTPPSGNVKSVFRNTDLGIIFIDGEFFLVHHFNTRGPAETIMLHCLGRYSVEEISASEAV